MKIRFQREYRHSPEAVWQALTDARAIRQWWVDTDFVPEVGREFFLRDKPQGSWDGMVRGRVLEATPPSRVRFSWVGGGHETTVTYELTPTPAGGTRLTLLHDGFKGLSGLFLSVMLRFGWRSVVNKLIPEMAEHIAAHGFQRPFPSPSKAVQTGTPLEA
jgi:uncharacterized protein YndB with AHSA1/START domain